MQREMVKCQSRLAPVVESQHQHNMCASLHDALARDLCTKTPKTHALRYCSVSFELQLRNHIFAKFRSMLKIRFVVLESSIAVAMNSTSMLQSCHYNWI